MRNRSVCLNLDISYDNSSVTLQSNNPPFRSTDIRSGGLLVSVGVVF